MTELSQQLALREASSRATPNRELSEFVPPVHGHLVRRHDLIESSAAR